MRCCAEARILVWMVALVCTADAWFVSDEEDTTSAAPTIVAISTPTRLLQGKVLEASQQHEKLVLRDITQTASRTSDTAALSMKPAASNGRQTGAPPPATDPPAVQVTKDYWDRLPDWLPEGVRQEFHKDNAEFTRSRSAAGGGRQPVSTESPATVAPLTRDYWDELPDWLPARVRLEFQGDNTKFARGLIGDSVETTSAAPTAAHVTRDYWEELPDWLPTKVAREFQRDNAEFARKRSGAWSRTSTIQPKAVHETKNFWDELPDWLPGRVKQEFLNDNEEFRRRSAWTPRSSAAQTTAQTKVDKATAVHTSAAAEDTLPPWLVEYMKSLSTTAQPSAAARTEKFPARPPLEKSDGQRSRSLSDGPKQQVTPTLTTSLATMPSTPPAPTRAPLTLSSSDQLPSKCSRQVNWLDQPKCSASRSKWTFNLVTLRCEWFVFYGCQLNNGNVFNSRRDCENYCIRGIVNPCDIARCVPAYSLYQSDCFLLNDTTCINSILQQYSYIGSPAVRMDRAKEQILLFCQPPVARCLNTGINARLPTYESPPTNEEPSAAPPHCLLPPDRGSCQPGQRVRMSRVYYYSQRHNQCKFMMHFGCGGNLNRFANQADCYNNCGI